MAIKDMKGTITKNQPTMTGMMNRDTAKLTPPDMSKIKMPTKKKQTIQQPVEQAAPQENELTNKLQNLTDEDKILLDTVLSPSVSKVLSKIVPDAQPLLDQFTSNEENVILPVSIVKDFANRKYGGTEQESVQSFVSDLAGQMEQSTVPPDTEMVSDPGLNIENEINDIDTDQITV
tara:strand:- start:224 stop:751 length:528 start_codon:yes stop_codon:yes gene_type:complete